MTATWSPMICPRRGFHQQGEATYIAERDGSWASCGDADVSDATMYQGRAEASNAIPPIPGLSPGPRPRPRRAPVECGALPFLIKRDGTWLFRGSPIGRRELVCLFSSVLKRDTDGAYWLETPAERGRIEVEDVPWTAVEMEWTGVGSGQVLSFRTNVDQVVAAGPEHPISVRHDVLTCEPTPYIQIRKDPGCPPLEARICRAVYYELAALAVPGELYGQRVLGVWSQHRFFSLGECSECSDA